MAGLRVGGVGADYRAVVVAREWDAVCWEGVWRDDLKGGPGREVGARKDRGGGRERDEGEKSGEIHFGVG